MTKVKRNRLANVSNPYQGHFMKVLCVCSAGILRSPTLAWILSNEPFNFNTRAVGTSDEYALVPVDEALIQWADAIVVMDEFQQATVNEIQNRMATERQGMFEFQFRPVYNFRVEDDYGYRDPALVEILFAKAVETFTNEEH